MLMKFDIINKFHPRSLAFQCDVHKREKEREKEREREREKATDPIVLTCIRYSERERGLLTQSGIRVLRNSFNCRNVTDSGEVPAGKLSVKPAVCRAEL
jgi:hypothetical protein